ncbi:hypothetical protein Glove_386g28 [Diversispora epigaea]|uniref:Uncharacterized protein n=1 Tax=Diversispora epigaea TaxID=1348612 RepID=A0A397HAX8_9GLOM|nr:hypothetical protein Glove_386g28 [Diversispora epigaea]
MDRYLNLHMKFHCNKYFNNAYNVEDFKKCRKRPKPLKSADKRDQDDRCQCHQTDLQFEERRKCGRPTTSEFNLHIEKCYAKAHYHRKKLAKMTQSGSEVKEV